MIVYRVENSQGIGPYIRGFPNEFSELDEMAAEHNGPAHPGIFRDTCSRMSNDYVCGFRTKKDAFLWFGDWLPKLEKEGFILKEFEIEPGEVIDSYSGKQIAFYRPELFPF